VGPLTSNLSSRAAVMARGPLEDQGSSTNKAAGGAFPPLYCCFEAFRRVFRSMKTKQNVLDGADLLFRHYYFQILAAIPCICG
jgi:hypothetical protein